MIFSACRLQATAIDILIMCDNYQSDYHAFCAWKTIDIYDASRAGNDGRIITRSENRCCNINHNHQNRSCCCCFLILYEWRRWRDPKKQSLIHLNSIIARYSNEITYQYNQFHLCCDRRSFRSKTRKRSFIIFIFKRFIRSHHDEYDSSFFTGENRSSLYFFKVQVRSMFSILQVFSCEVDGRISFEIFGIGFKIKTG